LTVDEKLHGYGAGGSRRSDTLLGIPIGVPSLDSAATQALKAVERQGSQVVFACANSHSMNVARHDRLFREALLDADQLVADGIGVSAVARLAAKDIGPRITGQQYFEAVMEKVRLRGHGRVFFFGSSQAVLDRIRARFAGEYPTLELCGAISPPFGDWSREQNDRFIEAINSAKPDVLWVGMTAPKQEKWVFENRRALDVPVIGSIGAVFDFFAGTVNPSPAWIRRCGLEAFYRLALEPKRLWRRVLVSNFAFLRIGVWTEVMRPGRDSQGSDR
jgi:N-acetylglucosaminyldiphosphoundecaprenol N-acetyl-beta-D-mannosaminyltransferase